MNQPGALLGLLNGMLANPDQRLDHMIKGVEIIIKHHQVIDVGNINYLQHVNQLLLLMRCFHFLSEYPYKIKKNELVCYGINLMNFTFFIVLKARA